MYYDDDSGAFSFLSGMVLGAIIGASVGLLMAPQSGKRTRKQLSRAVSDARTTATDRLEEFADQVQRAGRKRIRRQ